MPDSDPAEGLQKFLLENVESYEQLECLLAIAARPEGEWKADLVAQTSHLPHAAAMSALDDLVRRGLLVASADVKEPTFALARGHFELVLRLKELYRDQPLLVVRMMNANALERVRHEAAKTFSDAFLLRKKNPDG